jgi:hypothetical protein
MGEVVLHFFRLGELNTVRLVCKHDGCRSVTEIPLGRLEQAFQDGRCKVCHNPWGVMEEGPGPWYDTSWLTRLAQAVAKLRGKGVMVGIEFPVPAQGVCKLP